MRTIRCLAPAVVFLIVAFGCVSPTATVPTSRMSVTPPDSYADVAEKAIPSVVYIYAEVEGLYPPGVVASAGSGVILRSDGYILTNKHVVHGARLVDVTLENGQTYRVGGQWEDDTLDLAVIRIDAPGLTAMPFADPDKIRVGDPVLALGHALGVTPLEGGLSVTSGIVSNLGRTFSLAGSQHFDVIQTDAAINPGNSGGPLVNSAGELVGINSAGVPGAQNIGFAINVGIARHVFEDLVEYGKPQHPHLGVRASDVTQDVARRLKCKCDDGALVSDVESGGPAATAGLMIEDMITSIGGRRVNTAAELVRLLWRHEAGESVEIVFHRGGEEMRTTVTLGERTDGRTI